MRGVWKASCDCSGDFELIWTVRKLSAPRWRRYWKSSSKLFRDYNRGDVVVQTLEPFANKIVVNVAHRMHPCLE